MVISSRHQWIGALVLAATGLSAHGCQEDVSVGAVNRCGAGVEIKADTVREGSTRWITLRAGDRDGVVEVGENAKTLYVRVRTPGAEETRSFDVRMASLGRPPADVDYEAQIVVAGDWCP